MRGAMSNNLQASELHLWVVRATSDHPRTKNLLSADERSRAERFHSPLIAERWSYFHCALREVLARYTQLRPAELKFDTVKNDKPVVTNAGDNLRFNLSHSHDMALIAISQSFEVGADIERIRPLPNMQNLAVRNFSSCEHDSLLDHPESERGKPFYDIWTRKEAVIKANGAGLKIPLRDFTVPLGEAGEWRSAETSAIAKRKYLVRAVDLHPEYSAALCIETAAEGDETPAICVEHYLLPSR